MKVQAKVIRTFKAPRLNSGVLEYRTFEAGEVVSGTMQRSVSCMILFTDDNYSLPMDTISVQKNAANDGTQYQRYVPKQPNNVDTQGGVKPVDATLSKATSGDLVDRIARVTKGRTKGAMWGGVIGLGYALMTKKSLLLFAAGGALAGAFINGYFTYDTEQAVALEKNKTNGGNSAK